MATLQQIRTKANDKLAEIWPNLQARQDAYFAKHGKYFQLLAGSALTLDGADTAFTVQLPSDELYAIDINTAWSETVPFQLEVHEWRSGYLAIVTINHEGTLYRRMRKNTNEDTGWSVLLDPLTATKPSMIWPT
jgi:hypothetical protein